MTKEKLEKELQKCRSGECDYYCYSHKAAGISCSPSSRSCRSGYDENGEVFCDRLQRQISDFRTGHQAGRRMNEKERKNKKVLRNMLGRA